MLISVYIPGESSKFSRYAAAVEQAGGCPVFGSASDGEHCDALLLPGGGDLEPWRYGQENTASRGLEPERDALELHLLERFTRQKKPVLGICRGLQTINVFFGGDLIQDVPGHSTINGADRLHPTRAAEHSFLRTLYGEAPLVNSAHHQVIGRLGSGLEAVQWAEDSVVEAVCHRQLPVWAVQWHPERICGAGTADGGALFRAFLPGSLANGLF